MKISIGNLSQNLSENDLESFLSPHASITHLQIKRDKATKKSLGFGTFEVPDNQVEKVLSACNGKELDGKPISLMKTEDPGKASGQNLPKGGTNSKGPGGFGKNSGPSSGKTGVMRRGGSRGS